MLLFLAGLAAAAVPEGIDLDEVERWEDNTDRLLEGPAGCWELVGVASWDWQAGRFGENRGDAAFAGRLDEGVWADFHLEPLGEFARKGNREGRRQYTDERRFAPLIGKIQGGSVSASNERVETTEDAQSKPDNVLRSAIDELSGESTTSWATWSEAENGVVLHRDVPIGKGANAPTATVEVLFPAGGEVPSRWDVIFPEKFRIKDFPNPQIRDAEVHLRGHVHRGQVFPLMETFSFSARILGFRVEGAQTIVYKRATPCAKKDAATPVK